MAKYVVKMETADLDPRIKRTRRMLHQAFFELLAEKEFEAITVQDITGRSTLNRATFYDHFTDKFALLDDIIGDTFGQVFNEKIVGTSFDCPTAMKKMILAICDFLSGLGQQCQKHQRQFAPMVEAKVKTVVRDFLLTGLYNDRVPEAEAQIRAAMASWAVCGASLEWARTKSMPPDEFAETVLSLVAPALWDKNKTGFNSEELHAHEASTTA